MSRIFALQLRVGGELERLGPPRLQTPPAPDLRHPHVRDTQLVGQQSGRPVGDPQPVRRKFQRGQHDRHLAHPLRPARLRPVLQPTDPLGGIPALPPDHRRLGHLQPELTGGERVDVGREVAQIVGQPGRAWDEEPGEDRSGVGAVVRASEQLSQHAVLVERRRRTSPCGKVPYVVDDRELRIPGTSHARRSPLPPPVAHPRRPGRDTLPRLWITPSSGRTDPVLIGRCAGLSGFGLDTLPRVGHNRPGSTASAQVAPRIERIGLTDPVRYPHRVSGHSLLVYARRTAG
jgi:hypothetical protein